MIAPSPEFEMLSLHFHQGTFDSGMDLELIMLGPLQRMSHAERGRLIRYIKKVLDYCTADEMLEVWNRSKSDYAVTSGDIRPFFKAILDIVLRQADTHRP
jgi:hypothetical protein